MCGALDSRARQVRATRSPLTRNFGDGDRCSHFPHIAVTVNSLQKIRRAEWKASATRIFAILSLILGCALGLLCLVVLQSRSYRWWDYGLSAIFGLLGLLLAANLVYVGTYTLLRGTIPITPRPLLHRSDLVKARATMASMSTHASLICVVALFACCTALGAYSVVSLRQWVENSHAGSVPGFSFYQVLFGRPDNSLLPQWMFWALHFPVSMSVAIFSAMALGIVRERPGAKIAASMGTLFLTAPVTAIFSIVLLPVLSYLAMLYMVYLPMIPIGAFFLSLSRATLVMDRDTETQQSPDKHWSSRFLRTTLTVGCPVGLILGITLGALANDGNWIPGGIEIICAALYGASLVYADRRQGSFAKGFFPE